MGSHINSQKHTSLSTANTKSHKQDPRFIQRLLNQMYYRNMLTKLIAIYVRIVDCRTDKIGFGIDTFIMYTYTRPLIDYLKTL